MTYVTFDHDTRLAYSNKGLLELWIDVKKKGYYDIYLGRPLLLFYFQSLVLASVTLLSRFDSTSISIVLLISGCTSRLGEI